MDRIILTFVLLPIGPTANAQQDSIIAKSEELPEVVIEGKRIIHYSNYDVYLPGKEQKGHAANGLDLLSIIRLPCIRVDQVAKTVSSLASGEVQIRINNIQSSVEDLQALTPDQIGKVDYMTIPSNIFGDFGQTDYLCETNQTVMAEVSRCKLYGDMPECFNSSDGTSALLVNGVRRVGKSTLAKPFTQDFIAVDFERYRAGIRCLCARSRCHKHSAGTPCGRNRVRRLLRQASVLKKRESTGLGKSDLPKCDTQYIIWKQQDMDTLHQLSLYYLLAVNIITLIVFGIDKYKAKKKKWRIAETTLLVLAVIGGSIGAWAGMRLWHHKTLHRKFKYGVPVILTLQIALMTYLHTL